MDDLLDSFQQGYPDLQAEMTVQTKDGGDLPHRVGCTYFSGGLCDCGAVLNKWDEYYTAWRKTQ